MGTVEIVGVDGWAGGWVAIGLTERGFRGARRFGAFDELVRHYAHAQVIGVDIPFGFVDHGWREADRAARAFLVGQASSIFTAPARPVLSARDYDEAKALSHVASGKAISRQSFALIPKILEVDRFAGDPRIHEVHPEVSFRILNGGAKLGRKKTWGGLQQRLALLRSAGIALPSDLGEANDVGIDDVVDAAVVAWSGRRIAAGEALAFPTTPEQRDKSGRVIAIWG